MKKNIMTRIDEEAVEKAKELDLDISEVSESALKEMIRRTKRPKISNHPKDRPKNTRWWGCPDLNRGPERPRLRA